MLDNLLKTCGLNETEKSVLKFMIERKTSIASLIAKQLGMKRPNVYAVLDSLERMGLLTKVRKNKVSYYSVIPLKLIPKIFENQASSKFEEVKLATKLMKSSLEVYDNKVAMEAPFENVTFESIDAVYAQLEDALLGGDFCAIFNPQKSIFGRLKDVVLKFLNETAKTKPNIREIAVKGPTTDWYISKIKNKNHLVKQIPADQKVPSDIIMIKGSLIMLDYDSKNEVAIKITHRGHFDSMMTVFELLWKSL